MIEIPKVKDNEDTVLAKTTNDMIDNIEELESRLKDIESNPGGGGSTVISADSYIRRSIKNKMSTIMNPNMSILLAFSLQTIQKTMGDDKIFIDANEWANNDTVVVNYPLQNGDVDNLADTSLLDTGIVFGGGHEPITILRKGFMMSNSIYAYYNGSLAGYVNASNIDGSYIKEIKHKEGTTPTATSAVFHIIFSSEDGTKTKTLELNCNVL